MQNAANSSSAADGAATGSRFKLDILKNKARSSLTSSLENIFARVGLLLLAVCVAVFISLMTRFLFLPLPKTDYVYKKNKSTDSHTFIDRRQRLPCQLPPAHSHIWYVLDRHKVFRAWELDLLTKGLYLLSHSSPSLYALFYLLVSYRPLSLCIPAPLPQIFPPRTEDSPRAVYLLVPLAVSVSLPFGDLDWPISASETAE